MCIPLVIGIVVDVVVIDVFGVVVVVVDCWLLLLLLCIGIGVVFVGVPLVM